MSLLPYGCLLYTSQGAQTDGDGNGYEGDLHGYNFVTESGDITSVSYTHLDVYKRQPVRHSVPSMETASCASASLLSIPLIITPARTMYCSMSVSYTHLAAARRSLLSNELLTHVSGT